MPDTDETQIEDAPQEVGAEDGGSEDAPVATEDVSPKEGTAPEPEDLPDRAERKETTADQPHGPEGAPEADSEATVESDAAGPAGAVEGKDVGRRGVVVGDAWTTARSAETVLVIGVTEAGNAVVVDEEGNELEISAEILNFAYRHDGPTVTQRAGFGEGLGKD